MKYKDTIVKGAFWVSLSTFFNAFAQIFRLAVLTRFLPKSDFGLVALLTFVLNITYTFSDLGFSSALMHKKDITQKEFSSLYWIQLFFYSIIYLVIISFSNPISAYFEEERMVALLPLVLADMFMHGLGKLYETLLHKNFYYKVIAIRNISASLISLILAVVLALKGYGVYSLIYSTLCQSLLLNIYNLLMGQKIIRLKLYCSYKEIKYLIKLGVYQTGGQILDCLSGQLDILIVGKALGTEELGVYNLAKELFSKIKMIINSISNKVMLPIFSEAQDDNSYSKRIYLKMIKFLGAVNIPISSTIGMFSFIIIPLIYGNAYKSDVMIFAIMSIWAIIETLGNPVGNIVVAKGRTNLFFFYTCLRLCFYLPCLYIISRFGLVPLVIGIIILSYLSNILACHVILKPAIELNAREYQSAYFKLFEFSVVFLVLGFYFMRFIDSRETIHFTVKYASYLIVLATYLLVYYRMEKTFIEDLLVRFDVLNTIKRASFLRK